MNFATPVSKLQRETSPPVSRGELLVPEIIAAINGYARAKSRRDQSIALQMLAMLKSVYRQAYEAGVRECQRLAADAGRLQ